MYQRRKTRKDAGYRRLSNNGFIYNNHKKYLTLSKLGKDMLVSRLIVKMELQNIPNNKSILHKALKTRKPKLNDLKYIE